MTIGAKKFKFVVVVISQKGLVEFKLEGSATNVGRPLAILKAPADSWAGGAMDKSTERGRSKTEAEEGNAESKEKHEERRQTRST